jgi:adenylate cyclase
MFTKLTSEYIVDLGLEELKNSFQRSKVLIVVFLLILAAVIINLLFFVDESIARFYGGPEAFIPSIKGLVVFLAYETCVLLFLKNRIKHQHRTSFEFKVIHTFAEIAFPSSIMFYYVYSFGMLSFLDSPVHLSYFLFIILSILHLDYRVSMLTGIFSALLYVTITFLGFNYFEINQNYWPSTPENSHYLRALFYLFCGGAAAFVSSGLKGRIQSTFDNQQAKDQLQSLFGQQLSKEISQALIEENGRTKKLEATVMFLDIRNFTTFADTHSADEVVDFQNKFLAPVIDTINLHQGVVYQILGDGIMACFGSPVENVLHADVAFQASNEILKKVKKMSAEGIIPDTRIGIGLHSGEIISGNIGNEQRKQFSISGTPVIIASRLEQLNKRFGSEFLISEDVLSRISVGKSRVALVSEEPLKGFEKPIKVYSVEN